MLHKRYEPFVVPVLIDHDVPGATTTRSTHGRAVFRRDTALHGRQEVVELGPPIITSHLGTDACSPVYVMGEAFAVQPLRTRISYRTTAGIPRAHALPMPGQMAETLVRERIRNAYLVRPTTLLHRRITWRVRGRSAHMARPIRDQRASLILGAIRPLRARNLATAKLRPRRPRNTVVMNARQPNRAGISHPTYFPLLWRRLAAIAFGPRQSE